MKTTLVGSYPKVAEGSYGTKLRAAINQWQRKALSAHTLQQVMEDVTRAVIGEQEAAGIDIVTDGQMQWEDLVTPVASQWSHTEINGLTRYFNNNTYYRRPIIQGKPARKAQRLVEQFTFARSVVTRAQLKAVLPGPYTVAQLSENRTASDATAFLSDMAQLIRQEAEALQAAGATVIQLDEPALAFSAPAPDQFLTLVRMVTDGLRIPCVMHIYFGAPQLPLETLLESRVAGIGLDFVEAPQLADQISHMKWPEDKGLGVGCLDARNTRLESSEDIKHVLQRLCASVSPDRIYVSPNCGLEFLPHDRAVQKMKLLVNTVRAVQREVATCS